MPQTGIHKINSRGNRLSARPYVRKIKGQFLRDISEDTLLIISKGVMNVHSVALTVIEGSLIVSNV